MGLYNKIMEGSFIVIRLLFHLEFDWVTMPGLSCPSCSWLSAVVGASTCINCGLAITGVQPLALSTDSTSALSKDAPLGGCVCRSASYSTFMLPPIVQTANIFATSVQIVGGERPQYECLPCLRKRRETIWDNNRGCEHCTRELSEWMSLFLSF